VVAAAALAPLLVTARVLRRASGYARFDDRDVPLMRRPQDVSDEHRAVAAELERDVTTLNDGGPVQRLTRMRAWLDEAGDGVETDARISELVGGDVRGEWIVPPGCDTRRRLLYVHGGGYQLGSPRSHRMLTTDLARRTGCAVLVVDYRLMPENSRMAGIEDVRTAWELLVGTGPDGPALATTAYVAGDSAGANLVLALTHWVRDTHGRLPDAVVAFSPPTDSTLSSPSWHDNVDTDAFLGPSYRRLLALPPAMLFLGVWATSRIRPDDQRLSPLLDDLRGLPPTLVQASRSEMLFDDAVRYTNAARAAGSPVTLQVWPGMVHVWQSFDVPEAAEALDEVEAFLAAHDPSVV
jgi:acetyl esterase/lipase